MKLPYIVSKLTRFIGQSQLLVRHKRIALFIAGIIVLAGSVTTFAVYQSSVNRDIAQTSSDEPDAKSAPSKGTTPKQGEKSDGESNAGGGASSPSNSSQGAGSAGSSSTAGGSKSSGTSGGGQSSGGSTGGLGTGSGGNNGGTTTPPVTVKRDPLKQPFASSSIWNMPIGTSAQYVAANLPTNPGTDGWTPMPQIDNEHIILKPDAPLTQLRYSSAAWTGANRCNATGGTLISVPIPWDYIVPTSGDNNAVTFLMPDKRTLVQAAPFTRCSAGSIATAVELHPSVDLYGDGRTGGHGGSKLSAIGGTIRLGELRPGQQGMKHAIKFNLNSPQALFRCTQESECFRWPASTSDAGSVGDYGTATNNQNRAMAMGALLAIRPSVNINTIGLESVPGKQLAWTLQNYGGYVVDSTGGPAYAINAEVGPDGSMRDQFKADYGYDFEQRVNSNTSWSRDIQRLMSILYVVNNNAPTSIGGGGTPLQPLAPNI